MCEETALGELIAVSRKFGADSAFVLAGGGNTSWKSDDRLLVKASGHALSTITADGFVSLDRSALQAMLLFNWPADARKREALFLERVMGARFEPQRGQRPSVEALLHHLLPESLVVHTHPGLVNAVTCSIEGEKLSRRWWGDDVLWQEYVDPGAVLAQALNQNLQRHVDRTGKRPKAIFLQNHGLIVAGESASEIIAASDSIISRISSELHTLPDMPIPPADSQLNKLAERLARLHPSMSIATDDSPAVRWLAGSIAGLSAATAGPLTPDQIVYCRSISLILDPDNDEPEIEKRWQLYVTTHGFEPWILLVKNAGIIAMRSTEKMAQTTRAVFADAAAVYFNASRLGGVGTLSQPHRQFIEQWEVEAYRRSIAAREIKA